ncbi:acetyltransferase [Kitasatospora sp. MMS16-BH015]|uniref:GNAT family N-acetyltransferase n=1 Tax=Kitasatospora sp. MMS16-BH015 TaxID=2018025 RepID=UPI000CA3ABEF|nr:GNAT family N-acetyltransferase [Kitasatospora sp. MMS16-BH015]AUG75611.1 acetyltransferase [Kitasatospora sp. MMS16-BH015]
MDIRTTGYGHPDAQQLAEEVQQEYVRRYGDMDVTVMHPDHFDQPAGLFVVAYLDGRPVACGGWRAKEPNEHGLREGDAELKRMYVAPAARGRGLARAVLRHLEETARAAGRTRLVLESGTEQPEALGLYASEGYQPMAGFGVYRDAPECVCMSKELPVIAGR